MGDFCDWNWCKDRACPCGLIPLSRRLGRTFGGHMEMVRDQVEDEIARLVRSELAALQWPENRL